jgi:hypothetical protein
MSVLINRYINDNINNETKSNLLNNENENENEINTNMEDVVYVIKVNGITKCFCDKLEEINDTINIIIHKLNNKLYMEKWDNIKCLTKDNKILWKVIDSNKIVTQITGNKYNSLLFYEQIISEIEVEIVKKYNMDD